VITEHMESNVLHSYQADLMRSSVNELNREIHGLRSDISLLRSDAHSARMAGPGDRLDHHLWLLFLVFVHAMLMLFLLAAFSHKQDRAPEPTPPSVEAQ